MKNLILALVAVIGLVAFSGTASAQLSAAPDVSIVLYGASAQIKFWDALAEDFLLAPLPLGLGCTPGTEEARRDESVSDLFDDNRGTCAEGCTVDGVGGKIVCIKYSEIASFFGVEAVANAASGNQFDRQSCGDPNKRLVLDDACFTDSADGSSASCVLSCQTVHLGATDVNFEAFTQDTVGYRNGYIEPGSSDDAGWQNTTIANPFASGGDYQASVAIPTLGDTPGNVDAFTTNIVPFGIFVNDDLTESRCEAATAAVASSAFIPYSPEGKRCDSASDCIAYYRCASGSCVDETGTAIPSTSCSEHADCKVYDGGQLSTNATVSQEADWACTTKSLESLTQNEIQLAFANDSFGGAINNWSDLGKGLPSRPIGRCLRHAGSGTHATFDWTVIENYPFETTTLPFVFWHYASSSDLDDCIENNAHVQNEFPGTPVAFDPIAIGYLDADKVLNSSLRDVKLIALDGMLPEKENIINGRYQFWAEQVIYVLEAVTDGTLSDQLAIRTEMEEFAGDAATLATFGTELGETLRYWATFGEMNVTRNLDVRSAMVSK